MLAQYFIMRFDTICVEFLSSSNKLKGFAKENDTQDSQYKNNTKWTQYSIPSVSSKIHLSINGEKHVLTHKKIDDLADAFLQGLWYLNKYNIINIA